MRIITFLYSKHCEIPRKTMKSLMPSPICLKIILSYFDALRIYNNFSDVKSEDWIFFFF